MRQKMASWRLAPITLGLCFTALSVSVLASPPDEAEGRFSGLPSLEEIPDELEELQPVEPRTVEASPPPSKLPEPEEEPDQEPEPEPDQEPKLETKVLKKAKWIKHVILPGERLDEIADRYQVRKSSLIRWNKLDKSRPKIYAGRKLAVYTKFIPPPRQKLIYTVQSGDTWNKIAKAHHVDADNLRLRWNAKVPRRFKAGQKIVIWVDPQASSTSSTSSTTSVSSSPSTTRSGSTSTSQSVGNLPLVAISKGATSVGKPNRGKIVKGTRLPENKKLYSVRKPDEAYGSTHTLYNLQLAIANWRQSSGFKGDLSIGAISKKGGGKIKPHSSHQSGRDVDVRLPLKKKGGSADDTSDVDWDATWGLIKALVATGEIQYIFLSESRQKHLYKAAKRAGASKDMLTRVIQYPQKKGTNNGIVRHSKGHTAHFHVRFTCAASESRCESY